jgi:hypothetical protein
MKMEFGKLQKVEKVLEWKLEESFHNSNGEWKVLYNFVSTKGYK